jgi:prevent-host-death family protein
MEVPAMHSISATEARARLGRLIDEAAQSNAPLRIIGKRNNAVLVPEQYWESVAETLALLSIPGMCESIREGLTTALESCSDDPGW